MLLYIMLSLWIFFILLLGLRPDAATTAMAWPYQSESSVANRNAKICIVFGLITFAVLWFLTAFRSENIGNDTATYIYYFDIFSSGGIDRTRAFEIGYQYLNVLIGKVTRDPHIFLVIMATIMYFGVAFYIKKYAKNFLVSICLFFCLFFSAYTSMFRQGIAMIIILYAYQCMKEKKKIMAIVLIAIAFWFHKTAIVALLLLFCNKLFVNKKVVYLLVLISMLASQTDILYRVISIVLPGYAHYFASRYASSGWLAVSYELVRALLFFYLVSKRSNKNDAQDRLRMMNFALLLIFVSFGFTMNLFTRASQYFLLIGTVELPNFLYEKNDYAKRYWLFAIGLVSILMFMIILVFRPDWNHLYPYEFWE